MPEGGTLPFFFGPGSYSMARQYRRRVMRKRKAVRRKLGRGRGRVVKRSLNANKQDRAVVIETQELTATPEGGNWVGHQLGQYNRALAVSKNFRYYRCKKVELEFIPYANMFPGGTAFPELYYQVDRVQGVTNPGASNPVPTKNMMLARGCMPQKWTGVIKKSYVPSVCRLENLYQNVEPDNYVSSIVGVTTTPVKYKWYATQAQPFVAPPGAAASPVAAAYAPQVLRYFGAAYYIDQPLAPPSAALGTIKMRVHWEFKEPMWLSDTQAPAPIDTLPLSSGIHQV